MAYTNRRTLLNDMVAEEIVMSLRAGATFKHACGAAQVAPRTGLSWLEKGEAYDRAVEEGREPNPDHEAFADFKARVEQARNSARVAAAGTIMRAIFGDIVREPDGTIVEVRREPDWKAAAWFLERTDPAEWGRRWRPEETDAQDAQDTMEQAVRAAERAVSEAAQQIAQEAARGQRG